MAWYNEDHPDTLNFLLVGNQHSGYGLLQASLAAHPHLVCHGDVFHPDDRVRRREHEQYFGPSGGKFADHFVPTHLSAEQYLNNKLFDNTLHGERAVGVKIGYDAMRQYDLWDYLDQKSRRGDFCVVHVERNPVACFVARTQAAAGPGPQYLDSAALTEFCRDHLAAALKVNRYCPDRVVIPYHELVLDFRGVLERLCRFLELDFSPACIPNQRRFRAKEVRSRIANWYEVYDKVPSDVRAFLDDPTLY